jgi:hypothetical protein
MRSLLSPALSAAACFTIAGLFATPCLAQSDGDRATARSLGTDGQQALESKDYKTAEDRFRRADSLVHAPTLMLGLARALAGQGKYVEAQETYNRIVREGLPPTASGTFKRALADATKEVDTVSPKIGGATISVHGPSGADVPSAKVVLDGSPVSNASLDVRRSIDPGPHVLQVSADGFKPAELRFVVAEGGSADEPVTLEAEPSASSPLGAPPATQLPATAPGSETPVSSSGGGARAVLPWVAFGIGAAGLGVGAVTGFIAMGKHSDLLNGGHCFPDGTCDKAAQSDIDSYHTVGAISTVGFVVGGIGVVGGVVLLLTRPKAEHVAPAAPPQAGLHVVPVVGLGSIGATGRF